ncbi:carbamate kinase [Kushneria phosphatilytica]|uniref:Carbamate kinase n=1 Tax=Kushneria phosphatilytica TaxID=657387 RepID=A0A1S1NUX7_9GAMM|nr:carbamate kinase [Kushneria phosphatilytica]OHV10017.1 carbamate kinase [Kushneria phosphatilytica]QEL11701.1 carbamate kinase [Kushneria phosphatilytica]
MRYVIALGGNALLERGEPMTADNQRQRIREAAHHLHEPGLAHELVVVHGNGPQVGLLALQAAAYTAVEAYPLDVLGAESEGMIGYVLEQELRNALPERPVATLITQVEVARDDPAFQHPHKFIGPVYTLEESLKLAESRGWEMAADGPHYRRVVPSPSPRHVLEIDSIERLLQHNTLVICAGGGGVPVYRDEQGQLCGLEGVIDKDASAALLACQLKADGLLIVTDVAGIYLDWGTDHARRIARIHPDELAKYSFPEGSMQPKVRAAIDFVKRTGRPAMIGSLHELDALLSGHSGTCVTLEATERVIA